MQINFDLSDAELTHFSQGAKNRLTEQARQYTLEIISEANKVEEMLRENGASQEITESIVVQAIRRNKTVRKKNIGAIILKILSEILLFISGLLFLPDIFTRYVYQIWQHIKYALFHIFSATYYYFFDFNNNNAL